MAKRYWAFNTLAGCIRSNTGVVDGATTAGTFDSTYVASGISLPVGGAQYAGVVQPFADGSTSITGFVSIRFDYYGPFTNGGFGILTLLNAGANAYRIVATGTSSQVQYWNGTAWTNWGSTFNFVAATRNVVVLNLTPGTSFELFVNSVSVASGVTPSGAAPAFTDARWVSASSSGGVATLSQSMAADYDLRDAHLFSRLADAEGTYDTDGTGAYTDVNEAVLNDGTAIQLPTAGLHRTFTKAAISLPVGLTISGMMVNCRARIGGSVADGKLLCKQGVDDSLSAAQVFETAYDVRSAFFDLDPATASAWTETGFNSAEFGFEAI